MTNIIISSISGTTPLNIYVSDAFGGNEIYLGQVTTLPLVGGITYELPIIFNSAPQVTIIIQDSEGCRTTKKLNCYIDCDIVYSITNITSITPTPTPTPSSTPGYIPAPITNNTITLTSVTGTPPFGIYISDINGNYNTYVGIITNSTVLPISFDIPARFEGSTQVILTISDANSCSYFKIIDCGVINTPTPTPTPTNTVTPSNQTSPTPTPTNTVTPSITPSNQTSPTPTNTVTPSITPTNQTSPTPTPSPTQTPTTNPNVSCMTITGCTSGSICDCTGNPNTTMYYSGTLDNFNNPDNGVFYQTLINCQNGTPDYNGLTYFLDTFNQLYWQPDANGAINGYDICL